MPTVDGLPNAGNLGAGDEFVVSQAGGTGPTGRVTGKATLGLLQTWLGAIANAFSVKGLPLASTIAQTDFVAANVGGNDARVQVATLLQGQTADTLTTAAPVANTDTVAVLQGGNILLQQSFSAIWTWITATLPTYLRPTVELTSNTTLSIAHNQRMLICSASLTLTGTGAPAGLACDLIATSGATVTLAGFTTNTGTYSVGPGQSARIVVGSYSAGAVVYATLAGATLGSSSGSGSSGSAPGQVTGLAAGAPTTSAVPLSWTAVSGATAYVVQYQAGTGSGAWTTFATVSGTAATVTGLSASTGYAFQVAATNSNGTGAYSSTVTATTATPSVSVPGAITGLANGTPTSTTVPLTWTDPTSGGTATAITVQYRTPSGVGAWTTATSSLGGTATSYTVQGLTAGTAYDFQAFATNSSGSGAASVLTNVSTASSGGAPGAVTALANPTVTTSAVPLSWTAPSSGGAITNYTVQYRPHGSGGWSTASSTVSPTSTAATVQDLAANTAYDFQVFATNSSGSGTASVLSNVTTAGGTLPISLYPGLPDLPQNASYSLSASGDAYMSCVISGYASGASSGTLPGAVSFYATQTPSSVPAIGAAVPSGGIFVTTIQDGYLLFASVPRPNTPGTWYIFAVSTTSTSSSSPGVVAGSVIGTPFTITA